MFDLADLILVTLGLAFAVSIGAHYTGACMGMAYAGGAIRRGPALAIMAALAFAGAAIASGHVVTKVGLSIVPDGSLSVGAASIVVGVSFLLTASYNRVRLPTSTIQILVFSLVGVGLALGVAIDWGTIEDLLIVWALAPVIAAGLGYALTLGLSARRRAAASVVPSARGTATVLVAAGVIASFAMGANDVANAVAVFVTTHLATVAVAGVLGGLALALGVLTWGRPLLEAVAFDIVRLDPEMATAAQLSQGTVVLGAVLVTGTFTSMNQALIGAMAGAGLARHRSAVQWPMIRGILLGWALGPTSGLVAGYVGVVLVRLAGIPL
jgi:inorganic phosphate transporter, PiT family